MNTRPVAADPESLARLYPPISSPNWLVLRARREIFRRWLRALSRPYMLVLDVGGRLQPYRPLIVAEKLTYIAIDLRSSPLVDVIADARRLPFPDERFDLILCTQVMEYVANPSQVMAEFHRLLKPGGCLLASLPAIYPPDSETDAWRYLPAGIRHLTSAFASVEIAAEGNSVIGMFRTLAVWIDWFARWRWVRKCLGYTIVPAINSTAVVLDGLIRTKNDAMTANFSVLAKK